MNRLIVALVGISVLAGCGASGETGTNAAASTPAAPSSVAAEVPPTSSVAADPAASLSVSSDSPVSSDTSVAAASTVPPAEGAPTTTAVDLTPTTLPPELAPRNSPAGFTVVEGDFDLVANILTVDPLVLDTFAKPAPIAVVIASNGAGDAAKLDPAAPPAGSGTTVTYSYVLYNWETGSAYDASVAGELLTAVVDQNELSVTLNRALRWATENGRIIATLPAGSAEIPSFAPPDSAYYYVIDVFSVR